MLSDCSSFAVDQNNREQLRHGTTAFPAACYIDELDQSSVSWHWHDELEAVMVAEGEALVTIGDRTHTVCAGNGFVVNTGTLHSYQIRSGPVCHLHAMVFHPRLVGGSMESVFYQKYILPLTKARTSASFFLCANIPWQAAALKWMERAWEDCVQEPEHYEILVRSALTELLAILCDHVPTDQTGTNPGYFRNAKRMKQMLRFIQENYAEELNTAAIAASAAVSESECLRCFRAVIGTTPIQYLREYRIERAAQLLAESRIRISDAAGCCGFQDVSYFTKTFRKFRGCTPKEYQNTRLAEAVPDPSASPLKS